MNFLAHALFSLSNEHVQVGNLMSDFVKGKAKFTYTEEVQKGIVLHRSIDAYIDNHSIAKLAKQPFRPAYGLYAGAMVDVAFDYFVANDMRFFENDAALLSFSNGVYANLQKHKSILPARFANMLPYMVSQNWLYNYRFYAGMQQSFGGLVKRAAYLEDSGPAFEVFKAEKALLQDCYNDFMLDFLPWYKALGQQIITDTAS